MLKGGTAQGWADRAREVQLALYSSHFCIVYRIKQRSTGRNGARRRDLGIRVKYGRNKESDEDEKARQSEQKSAQQEDVLRAPLMSRDAQAELGRKRRQRRRRHRMSVCAAEKKHTHTHTHTRLEKLF